MLGFIVRPQQLGIGLIITLVALRVAIGMHFFREGLSKIRDPQPFSAGFFGNAKGPMEDMFRQMVWDRDGAARLNIDATLRAWDQYRAQVESHYGFDANQKKRAEAVFKRYESEVRDHLRAYEDDLREYRGLLERRNKYRDDPAHQDAPSLREHISKIEADLRSKRGMLLNPIDALWQGYAHDLNGLATKEQREQGVVSLAKPGRRLMDSETIDRFIPWFDATIGVLLIAGLFTRPAAVAAALFLISVVASQWPTSPGAAATWPQAIEAIGLLVIAAAGAGKYAGFDAIFSACCRRKDTRQGMQS